MTVVLRGLKTLVATTAAAAASVTAVAVAAEVGSGWLGDAQGRG